MKKEKQKNRRYDSSFKKQALALVRDGRKVSSVAKSLGISTGVLYSWQKQSKLQESVQPEEEELKILRKRLREVEQERDILKKVWSIFSRKT